jgi:hypothetical protein
MSRNLVSHRCENCEGLTPWATEIDMIEDAKWITYNAWCNQCRKGFSSKYKRIEKYSNNNFIGPGGLI